MSAFGVITAILLLPVMTAFAQINCPPSLPLTLIGNTDYCIGSDGADLSVEQNYAGYEWIPSGLSTQSALLTAGSHWVVVTHYTGCTDTLAFQVQQVSNPPQPTIVPSGPVEFCEGGSVTLTVPGWYPYYDWNTGSVSDEITVHQSGTFVVSITDWIGCSSSSNLIEITVDPLPVAAFSPNLDMFDVSFNNHSQNATSYEWNFGDGTFSTEFEPSHSFTVNGTSPMWLVAFNDCGSDTAFLDLESVGISEENEISDLNIFPNPTLGNLNLDFHSLIHGTLRLELVDLTGRVIIQKSVSTIAGQNNLNMDLESASHGMYQLRIRSKRDQRVVQLVVGS
jgi:hypothetical protein